MKCVALPNENLKLTAVLQSNAARTVSTKSAHLSESLSITYDIFHEGFSTPIAVG